MKRSSLLLSSSRFLASAFSHPSHKPWLILNRHTCHPSHASIQSLSDTCHASEKSPINTWSKWPSPPSFPRRGMPKFLPKLMYPFHGSMFTPPLLPQENPHGLHDKHDPTNTLSSDSVMPSVWFQKSDTDNKNVNDQIAMMGKMRRLLQLAQLDALKERLEKETHDVMAYGELLDICIRMGVASSPKGATLLVKRLDDAGSIFIFQDTVYLKPKKIAQLMSEVMPRTSSTSRERESIFQEMSRLKQEKDEIDKLAYTHSRKVLWSGFGYLVLQMALIFRFTFWELSWDVMEPIAYFVTNITLLLGYAFFMITSKHPTYRDLTSLLISSKQKNLMKARNFNIGRLLELQNQYGLSTPFLRGITTCN